MRMALALRSCRALRSAVPVDGCNGRASRPDLACSRRSTTSQRSWNPGSSAWSVMCSRTSDRAPSQPTTYPAGLARSEHQLAVGIDAGILRVPVSIPARRPAVRTSPSRSASDAHHLAIEMDGPRQALRVPVSFQHHDPQHNHGHVGERRAGRACMPFRWRSVVGPLILSRHAERVRPDRTAGARRYRRYAGPHGPCRGGRP